MLSRTTFSCCSEHLQLLSKTPLEQSIFASIELYGFIAVSNNDRTEFNFAQNPTRICWIFIFGWLIMPKGIHLLTMGTFNRFLVLNTFSMDEIKYV